MNIRGISSGQGPDGEAAEFLGIDGEGVDGNLDLLHLVDLTVDLQELRVVGSPEVGPSGLLCYLLQQVLVYLHWYILHLHSERSHHGIGSRTHCSHSYRIDADAVGLGYFRSSKRRYLAAVVHSVREQDHHPALGLGILEAGHRIGQAIAYGSTVIYQAALYLLDQVYQRSPVCGKGRLGVALAGKDHHSDTVRGPLGDELYGNVLGRLDTVRGEVTGQHTGGYVEGQDYVDTLGVGLADIGRAAGTGHSHYQQGYGYQPQYRREMAQHPGCSCTCRGERGGSGHGHVRTAAAHLFPYVPGSHRDEQQFQPQHPRILKEKVIHRPALLSFRFCHRFRHFPSVSCPFCPLRRYFRSSRPFPHPTPVPA